MKVALYARVSKGDDSQDPNNQFIRLRQYAQERSWTVAGEYVDMASGADQWRPQLEVMLRDARAHRFELVLTTKVDRIARSVPNLYEVLKELEASGVQFKCSDQDISTESATGKLMLNVLAAVAEFERELIRDRTKAGLVKARLQGKTLGRPSIAIDMDRVRSMRGSGLGLRAVAKALGVSHQTIKNRLRKEGAAVPSENTQPSGGLPNGR
jgi:DNA invertase Pin-like site-specific DNA recombinase